MDRFNWPCNNTNYDHYYNQAHQEDGQHTFQPETGQTSAGPQPMALEDIIPSQRHLEDRHLEDSQHTFAPETGQTSAGGAASGALWSYPAPGQPQPYLDLNPPAQIPSWPRPDWGAPQPTTVTDVIQNDTLPNPQPAAPARRRKAPTKGLPPVKERFMAGLEAFGRGAPLVDCSSSLRFSAYITDNGTLVRKGIGLYRQLTDAEKTRLDHAITTRKRAVTKGSVKKRFLAGLDNYARGAKLKNCSATLQFKTYVTDDGHLHKDGKDLCKGLSREELNLVHQALLCRRDIYLNRVMNNASTEERFLAGLDKYAQGVPLTECFKTIRFGDYVTDNGLLRPQGEALRKSLSEKDQARVDEALVSRSDHYLNRVMNNASTEERFLASLDNYAKGLLLSECAEDICLRIYLTDDCRLHPDRGQPLYNKLSQDDKARVDDALTARRKVYAQRIAKDVDNFMITLEPYANGLSLQECETLPGLKKKASAYLTPEGGLTHRGKLLIENLQPDQLNKVLEAIEKRQQHTELNPQVPEPAWQWPEMLSPMPETGGVDPTAMADPIQTEAIQAEAIQTEAIQTEAIQTEAMQTEAMWAMVWQLTGQAVPGPSGSAAPPIPDYDNEAIGADFQH
ncbi:MAG: hypothetical protein P8X89_22685 [Reinekea sp.]